MAAHQTDVIVIGLGPAGESVGGQLGEAGLNVVGIEAAAERLLPRNEPEAGDVVAEVFRAEGIHVHLGTRCSYSI